MAFVRLESDKEINKIIAGLPQVEKEVEDTADKIARNAAANLAARRESGDARITVDHSGRDSVIYLDDELGQAAALSIEYGHVTADGEWVEGTYVLHRAAGLA